MLPLVALLVVTLAPGLQGQNNNLNVNIVCNTLVSKLDCSHFPKVSLCGNDGKTYNTECDYAKAHCTNRRLHVHKCTGGSAQTKPPASKPPATNPPASVPPSTQPPTQAATDTTKPPVTMTTTWIPSGATLSLFCQTFLVQACPTSGSPVCGSDGVTYNTFCEYQKRKCAMDSLTLLHAGACLPGEGMPTTTPAPLNAFEILCNAIALTACPADSDPLCGSDGKTYTNPCELEKVKCQNPGLVATGLGNC